MKKFIITLACSLVLIASVGIIVNAKNMNSKTFIGQNGTIVNLYYTDTPDIDYSNVPISSVTSTSEDEENLKVGDIIFENGVKQVVFAVSEDGAYITQTYEDYVK